MKITDVKVYPLFGKSNERVTGFLTRYPDISSKLSRGFKAVYVKIETDEGIYGWGECIVREFGKASADIILNIFRPVLLGKNPLETEVLWDKLFSMLRIRGHSYGFFVEAISGVDLALWDIKGKYFETPVYKLLGGGFSTDVEAYLSSIVYKDKTSASEEVKHWVYNGFRSIKIKIGQGYEKDLEIIKTIRETVGYEVELMADANTAYNATSAIKVGRMLEKFEFSWFEEPIKPDNLRGYRELSRALDIPLCAAETFFSKHQWKEFLADDAIDIVQPDIARVGGITEGLKIIALAESFDKPITFHVGLSGLGARASALHLSAIVPNDLLLKYEYYYFENPLVTQVVTEPLEVFNENRVKIPSANGLGINIDEARLKNFLE